MKVVAIVQARLRSTRLPAKILLPLPSGRVVLEETVFRCKQASRVHQVVVASPDTEECDILKPYTGGTLWVRGSEQDVLDRTLRAAEMAGADIIVRVTSDCPAIAPSVIDDVILQRNIHGLSYACNVLPDSWPLGYAAEAFTMNALRYQAKNNWSPEAREHVTPALRRMAEGVKHANVPCPYGDFSYLRWTLDTLEDYTRIVRVFEGAHGAMNMLDVVRA